jgi:hypothetical protein
MRQDYIDDPKSEQPPFGKEKNVMNWIQNVGFFFPH